MLRRCLRQRPLWWGYVCALQDSMLLCDKARDSPDMTQSSLSTCSCMCCRAGSSSEDETSVGKHAQLARLISAAVVRMSLPPAKAALSGDRGGVLLQPCRIRCIVCFLLQKGADALLGVL